ncbi:MAG: hypothetical protein ACI4EY_04840 [Lachnospiraceae bacterium]
MKKEYVTPTMVGECFIANEFVSTCWRVGCKNTTTQGNQNSNAPYSNMWKQNEGPYDNMFSHDGDCRNASNNYFQANGTNIIFEFERNSEQGNLGGGFDNWVDVNNNNIVDTKDVVFWHTSNKERTWNHWGYVESVDAAHINRS